MRKIVTDYIKFFVGQVVACGILIAMFGWMTTTGFELARYSSKLPNGGVGTSTSVGFMVTVSMVTALSVVGMLAIFMVNVIGEGRWARHDLQPYTVKPIAFRRGVSA